jgi:hypothetical protein
MTPERFAQIGQHVARASIFALLLASVTMVTGIYFVVGFPVLEGHIWRPRPVYGAVVTMSFDLVAVGAAVFAARCPNRKLAWVLAAAAATYWPILIFAEWLSE